MNVYVESSALLAVLLRESESEKTAILLEQSTVRVASMLTFLECRRAISKLVAGQIISEAIGREVVGELRQFEAACDVMEISSDAAKRAGEQFPKEPVRTLDAIHLATALEFSEMYPKLMVLTHDKRLSANLSPLGLAAALDFGSSK